MSREEFGVGGEERIGSGQATNTLIKASSIDMLMTTVSRGTPARVAVKLIHLDVSNSHPHPLTEKPMLLNRQQ